MLPHLRCGQGRTRKRTPGKGSQERQAAAAAAGKSKGKVTAAADWSLCMHAVRDLAVVARRVVEGGAGSSSE